MNANSDPTPVIQTPAEIAQAAVRSYPVAPPSFVSYVSRGHLLVLAKSEQIESILPTIPPPLKTYAVLADTSPLALLEKLRTQGLSVLDRVSEVELSGYLGAFQVTASHDQTTRSINRYFDVPDPGFDLVLDLLDSSAPKETIPPVGCFVLGAESDEWSATVTKLSEWVGQFQKPKYFHYREDICAHSARGVEGCRLCIEACATGAIRSDNHQLRINPMLCQGCGDCTTVCPSGALNYAYPKRSDSLNRIRRMLAVYSTAGGKVPLLLLHDAQEGRQWLAEYGSTLPINVLPYEIEALAAAGMDLWLGALAYGAVEVLLLHGGKLTKQDQRSLNTQLECARAILTGMGYPASNLRSIRLNELRSQAMPVHTMGPTRPPARFTGSDDKRTAIRMAVDHLLHHAPEHPKPIALSAGAPFGELAVDAQRCTLCMACVSACPEAALEEAQDQRQLKFTEARCVQCDLCERICPEDAIERVPRFLYDTQIAGQPRLLHQAAGI